VPALLESEDDTVLLNRRDAATQIRRLHSRLQRLIVHLGDLCAGQLARGRLCGFGSLALGDELLHCSQFHPAEYSVLIGFGECSLDVGICPGGNLDSGVDGQASCLDAHDEAVFAVSEKIDDAVDVCSVESEFFSDGRGFVMLCVEAFYFAY
jgi:hypothetical protein